MATCGMTISFKDKMSTILKSVGESLDKVREALENSPNDTKQAERHLRVIAYFLVRIVKTGIIVETESQKYPRKASGKWDILRQDKGTITIYEK